MKLVFIDEVYGSKETRLFGLGILITDLTKYNTLFEAFYSTLKKHKWPLGKEIKGKYIFSRNAANSGKTPAQMVELTKDLTSNLLAKKTARGELLFVCNKDGFSVENYCNLITTAVGKVSKCNSKKNGKHLISCFLDDFNDLRAELPAISGEIKNAFEKRGYKLIEASATPVKSDNSSPGIIYADLLTHLARWVVENPTIDSNTPDTLFDWLVPDSGAVNTQKTIIARNLLFNRIKGWIIKS